MMNRLINPIIFIICLFVTACSDDNNENEPITPFSLGNTYYEGGFYQFHFLFLA